jgi:hypothetical protein
MDTRRQQMMDRERLWRGGAEGLRQVAKRKQRGEAGIETRAAIPAA